MAAVVHGVRRAGERCGLDRAGAPRRVARRPPGRGQGAVPRGPGGADRRRPHAVPGVPRRGPGRQGPGAAPARGRAAGPVDRGAGLPARGTDADRVRHRVRRRRRRPGARGGAREPPRAGHGVAGRRPPVRGRSRRSAGPARPGRRAVPALPRQRSRARRAAAHRPTPGELPVAAGRPAGGAGLRLGAGPAGRHARDLRTAAPGPARRGPRRGPAAAARGALRTPRCRGRRAQARRLHGAVHRPGPPRALPLQPGLAALGVRPGERPAQPGLRRRAVARPAGRAPVHPPGVAGHGRRAVPARGRRAGTGGPAALAAGLRPGVRRSRPGPPPGLGRSGGSRAERARPGHNVAWSPPSGRTRTPRW